MFSAAILAGGRATRMGGIDKSALVVDGVPILDRQRSMLATVAGLDEILFVGRSDAASGLRAIPDRVADSGPLGGIHAALTAARSRALFVLACDMPFVPAALVEYLVALSVEADAVVPQTAAGYHPLCAVYTRACLAPAARRLGDRRLKVIELLEDVRARIVTAAELDRFGDGHRLLSNVNTPLDHRALAGERGHQL
jgi:molybdenum cofactor guanylyltransferase